MDDASESKWKPQKDCGKAKWKSGKRKSGTASGNRILVSLSTAEPNKGIILCGLW
jgi:hypothetical protein